MPDSKDIAAGTDARVEQIAEDSEALVLKITGEVNPSNAPSLRAKIDQILERGPGKVVFELGDLRFMDSSGIALLLTVMERVTMVEIRNPSQMMRRVIELSGLAAIFQITP